MTNFYNQSHIFVVFRPGAGGNFISSLLDNLLQQNFNTVKLSDSGRAHYNNIVERKRLGKDYLSFGSGLLFADPKFPTVDEKIKFYKNGIDNSDYLNQPYITWTHSFGNIPIYRSIFPNGQILSISEDTLKERLAGLIMHVNKNHFSNDNQFPFPAEHQIKPQLFKATVISNVFSISYPGKIYQSGHLDIDRLMLYKYFLKSSKLEKYLNYDLEAKIPYEDTDSEELILTKNIGQFSVDRHYISLCSSTINYSDILNGSADKIVREFETVLKRPLTDRELQCVDNSLDEYVKSQNLDIISDPKKYLDDIKEKADMIVSAFKG
jgi:hypothetical protein